MWYGFVCVVAVVLNCFIYIYVCVLLVLLRCCFHCVVFVGVVFVCLANGFLFFGQMEEHWGHDTQQKQTQNNILFLKKSWHCLLYGLIRFCLVCCVLLFLLF